MASYPFQYFCLDNFTDRRSLAYYSPWGHKESDLTEQLRHMHTKTYKSVSGGQEKLKDLLKSPIKKLQNQTSLCCYLIIGLPLSIAATVLFESERSLG